LDKVSARREGLYLHRTQITQDNTTDMPRAGFESAIPATKRPQTYALDRAATGIGCTTYRPTNYEVISSTN
jgi:hypothetical protein